MKNNNEMKQIIKSTEQITTNCVLAVGTIASTATKTATTEMKKHIAEIKKDWKNDPELQNAKKLWKQAIADFKNRK
jgi:hypothetical protein